MDNKKKYNIFILFSTLSRNIVEIFSSVLLYKMGYTYQNIILFYIIIYLVGAFTSIITMYLTNIIKSKYILIISSIIFSISFYYMSIMKTNIYNLIIFSIIYSISLYTYHTLKHYLAFQSKTYSERKGIGNILIYTNIGMDLSILLSSIIQSKLSTISLAVFTGILSLIGIIPIINYEDKNSNTKIEYPKIQNNKKLFFILEQSKVILLNIQPLYLFLFINNKIEYVGIFNLIMTISSVLFIFLFVRKIDDKKYFKYINIILVLILLIKLNIKNKYLMLVISFFEGIGIKSFEIVSSENMYDINKEINKKGYTLKAETIFCITNVIMYTIFYIINNIKITIYILILILFIISFINRKIK